MPDPNTSLATRIEGRIDKSVSANTGLTPTGSMAFSSVEQIMEFAKVMAIAGVAVPKHLRENVGACLAVAIQASEWQMSPFAVASKTYVVNDRIAFEAQLVNAVILKRAPIKGRFKISHSGEGANRRCKVSATLEDGDTVDYESPTLGSIPVKNSPLWKGDPDQQLFYYSSRAMCRRHFPDVLLGIYTPDELTDAIDGAVQVEAIPAARLGAPKNITPLEEAAPQLKSAAPKEKPTEPDPASESQEREYVEGGDEEPEPEPNTGPTAAELKAAIVKQMGEMNVTKFRLNKALVSLKIIASGQSWDAQDAATLLIITERWPDVQEWIKDSTED